MTFLGVRIILKRIVDYSIVSSYRDKIKNSEWVGTANIYFDLNLYRDELRSLIRTR